MRKGNNNTTTRSEKIMTYEDIACMSPTDAEKTIRELLAIAITVAIIGVGVPLKPILINAAKKFV